MKNIDLSCVQIMGILNVTPDSFSDGGELHIKNNLSLDLVLKKAESMIADGVNILDVGGESTRPGAVAVSEQEELDRVIPVINAIKKEFSVAVSVDTSTAAVMRESAASGVDLINDVRALQRQGALQAAAESGLPICLMHMQGEPQTMQVNPVYDDVIGDVSCFFQQRIRDCLAAGIASDNLMLDPGFGFGKTLEHNLSLLAQLDRFHDLGFPLLVGLSRKSLISQVLNKAVDQRLSASLALAVMAVERGAKVIRVHDVQETVDVVRMTEAVLQNSERL